MDLFRYSCTDGYFSVGCLCFFPFSTLAHSIWSGWMAASALTMQQNLFNGKIRMNCQFQKANIHFSEPKTKRKMYTCTAPTTIRWHITYEICSGTNKRKKKMNNDNSSHKKRCYKKKIYRTSKKAQKSDQLNLLTSHCVWNLILCNVEAL